MRAFAARPAAAPAAAPCADEACGRSAAVPAAYWAHYGIQRQASCGHGGGGDEVPAAAQVGEGGGAGLTPEVQAEMAGKLGGDLSSVRVHTDAAADAACAAVHAEAFTRGAHVYFRRGRFDPTSPKGRELLAHELAHVVQQQGGARRTQHARAVSDEGDAAEVEARAAGASVAAGHAFAVRASAAAIIHRRPSYIIDHTFLGQPIEGGINPVMRQRLITVEQHLQTVFDGLPADQRQGMTFVQWAGIREPHKGWTHGGFHASGSAIDVNHRTNPYIASGTASHAGGEQGYDASGARIPTPADLQAIRNLAVQVYRRAASFTMYLPGHGRGGDARARRAGVAPREGMTGRPRESTADLYDRLQNTSSDLAAYLQFAFHSGDAQNRVARRPLADPEHVDEARLLASIPTSERLDPAAAVAAIAAYMNGAPTPVPWELTPEQQYVRMLRDYEIVRVPMQWDSTPTARPGATRNPANGFIDLRREFVIAMCDVGHMRWGGGDFGAETGDVMHFDMGTDAGYARDNPAHHH